MDPFTVIGEVIAALFRSFVDYLLANDNLNIEIDEEALAILFNYRVDLAQIEPNLKRLVTLRSLMPEYLFSGSMR